MVSKNTEKSDGKKWNESVGVDLQRDGRVCGRSGGGMDDLDDLRCGVSGRVAEKLLM